MACLPSVWSTMSLIFLQWKLSWLGARSACMELTTLPLMLSSTFSMLMEGCTETLGSVGAGESKRFRLERCGCFELEPLFSGERVDHFLLLSLLAVAFFTFALSHRLNIQIFYKLNIKNRGIYLTARQEGRAEEALRVEGCLSFQWCFGCFERNDVVCIPNSSFVIPFVVYLPLALL